MTVMMVAILGLQVDDTASAPGQPCGCSHVQDFANYLISNA